MAPNSSTPSKTLNQDQARLLLEVCNRADVSLSIVQWNDLASDMGISNGKAAKERFRYLMKQLSDGSGKATNKKTSTPNVSKTITPSNSAGSKRQSVGNNESQASKKKPKTVKDQVKQDFKHETDEAKAAINSIFGYEQFTPEEYRELRKDIQAHDIDGLFTSMEHSDALGIGEEA